MRSDLTRLLWVTAFALGGCRGEGAPVQPTEAATAPAEAAAPAKPVQASPAGGRIAVQVEAEAPVEVTLTGPGGERIAGAAPLAACAVKPGAWQLVARAAGYREAALSLEVVDGKTTAASLGLLPAAELEVKAADGAALEIEGPDGQTADVTAPWIGRELTPGVYRVSRLDERGRARDDLGVAVRPRVRTVVDLARSAARIRIAREEYAAPPDLTIVSWRERGSPTMYRGRARRHVEDRPFDLGPVEDLDQLGWKARSAIVFADGGETVDEAFAALIARDEGRHFLVAADGTIHQLADLADWTHAPIDERVAETSVLIGLVGTVPTAAQQRALGGLAEALSALLPRVQPVSPRRADGRPMNEPLVDPRMFKGFMERAHVDPQFTTWTGVDWDAVEARARGQRLGDGVPEPVGGPPTLTLWASGADGAKLRVTPPGGAEPFEVEAAGAHVVCEPARGAWTVRATADERAAVQRRVDVAGGATWLELPLTPVGDLELTGRAGSQVTVEGPGELSLKVRLPWVGRSLMSGTYRVSVDRGSKPPWRAGVRVPPAGEARLEVPDLGDANLHSIIVDGVHYELPRGVVTRTFDQPDAMSFYAVQEKIGDRDRVYMPRHLPSGDVVRDLDAATKVTHLVVLHADTLADTETTFEVLASRGLSSHFAIEWDGTIHQLLDPVHVAFAAAEVNPYAIQIDLNNRLPNLVKRPRARPWPRGHPRLREMRKPEYARPKSQRVVINGRDVRSYGYTDAQYRSLTALLQVLTGLFPRVDPVVPRDSRGRVPWNFVDGAERFGGIVAHWHLTPRRWDPGPGFDWERLVRGLAGR